jgi:apolipoprotein D and lipocalin family protein
MGGLLPELGMRSIDSAAELDARIFAAEQAVIERDERLRHHARTLTRRLRRFTRGMGGSLALAGASMLLSRLLIRRGAPARPSDGHEPLWPRMLAFVWPWMPGALRERVSPATAALVIELLQPLLARRRGPAVAPHVDLQRYAGTWFEVACFGRDDAAADEVTTSFAPAGRRRIVVTRRRRAADGRERVRHGLARVRDVGRNAKLELSFARAPLRWLPFAWSRQWILDVDEDYRNAVVGTPDRRALWLLSRSPAPGDEAVRRMLLAARTRGYDIARLRAVGPR